MHFVGLCCVIISQCTAQKHKILTVLFPLSFSCDRRLLTQLKPNQTYFNVPTSNIYKSYALLNFTYHYIGKYSANFPRLKLHIISNTQDSGHYTGRSYGNVNNDTTRWRHVSAQYQIIPCGKISYILNDVRDKNVE